MGFTLGIGAPAPDFRLKGVDGRVHELAEYAAARAVVVIVSCNHCPTVIACEDRMVAIQRDYAGRGVQLVVINGNETDGHPTDSFEHMVERARAKGYNFPYLRDETQETVRALGAVRTPEVFLFGPDRTLAYHGRIDDSPDDAASVGRHDLREALDEVLAGRPVSVPQTVPVGCTVKWWGKDPHWMPAEEGTRSLSRASSDQTEHRGERTAMSAHGKKVFTAEQAKQIGEQLGVDWSKFDVEQYRRGMDVELEHGLVDPSTNVTNDDPLMTGKIALAHLNEFPDYYTRLDEMEEEAEEYWEKD